MIFVTECSLSSLVKLTFSTLKRVPLVLVKQKTIPDKTFSNTFVVHGLGLLRL